MVCRAYVDTATSCVALALATLLLAAPASAAEPRWLTVEPDGLPPDAVCSIHDADTWKRCDGSVQRAWGYDASEYGQTGGSEARMFVAELILGTVLTCKPNGKVSHDRPVIRCKLPDGRDLGSVVVTAGMAWDEPAYSKGAYRQAQSQAMCARRGLWAGAPIAPWAWRRCWMWRAKP